jgi:hypothetical protein
VTEWHQILCVDSNAEETRFLAKLCEDARARPGLAIYAVGSSGLTLDFHGAVLWDGVLYGCERSLTKDDCAHFETPELIRTTVLELSKQLLKQLGEDDATETT